MGEGDLGVLDFRRYLYTTNQLERLAKEVKRRTKLVEVFCSQAAVEKLLYLVLPQVHEAWGARRLPRISRNPNGKLPC